MLAKLVLSLKADSDKKISMSMSSAFQGVLMEVVGSKTAAWLHENQINPYSQYIQYKDNNIWWNILTATKEAFEKVIKPFMEDDVSVINVKYSDMKFEIIGKKMEQISMKSFMKQQYFSDYGHFFTINFLSPTSFKSDGNYKNYPTIHWIFRSLMKKHDAICSDNEVYDDEVLALLEGKTFITQYNLRSTIFYLEGVKIPAFLGKITILVKSSQSLVNLVNYLLMLGEYTGVGIKSSIGMGAISVEHKERGE